MKRKITVSNGSLEKTLKVAEKNALQLGFNLDNCSVICKVVPKSERANVGFSELKYEKSTMEQIKDTVITAGYNDKCLFKYKVSVYEK